MRKGLFGLLLLFPHTALATDHESFPASFLVQKATTIIKSEIFPLQSCYQKALAQVPDLQGTVQIQSSVGSGGSVLGARVQSSSLKNATAERCILRNIYGIRFDSPAGGTAIFTYPFSFTRL